MDLICRWCGVVIYIISFIYFLKHKKINKWGSIIYCVFISTSLNKKVKYTLFTRRERHGAAQQNTIEPIIISDAVYTECGASHDTTNHQQQNASSHL